MSMVVSNSTPQQNPLSQLLAKFDGVEKGFKAWLAKQSLPVEAAVVTTAHAAQGSAFGVVAGTLINNSSSLMDFQAPVLPLVLARSIGLMAGVNAGISCVMKRLRRKEDTPSRMAAGFCSGFVFGYVINPVDCLDPTATAIMGGIWHALFQGLAIQLEQDFALRVVADLDYSRTRSILKSIGMRKYEYNFRRGLLTDRTLPLLTDSVLKDVGVPPGPRLLILDRIKRFDSNLITSLGVVYNFYRRDHSIPSGFGFNVFSSRTRQKERSRACLDNFLGFECQLMLG